MQFIKHRVNDLRLLALVDRKWGVEMDIRSRLDSSGRLHVTHDPWVQGDDFEDWLREFRDLGIQGPLILNVKEDGLEGRILEILAASEVSNAFFLDTTIPSLVKWSIVNDESRFAVRVSKYEPLAGAEVFAGHVRWAWVDCFARQPLSEQTVKDAAKSFQVCLVSPELQGGSLHEIEAFSHLAPHAAAICTKHPDEWLKCLGR